MRVLELVETGANPDYLPLALRELSRNVDDGQSKVDYALRCGEVVIKRGRFVDRVECLEYIGGILLEAGHEKGTEYLEMADVFQQKQKRDNLLLPL
jgi:hypothetical protein